MSETAVSRDFTREVHVRTYNNLRDLESVHFLLTVQKNIMKIRLTSAELVIDGLTQPRSMTGSDRANLADQE